MIVIDTSALMAILLKEPRATACVAALAADDDYLISAGTLAEAFIVAAGRDVFTGMHGLIARLSPDVVSVSPADAERIGETYRRWGRGFHPAALNFGDCFAYALATQRGCPLLYVGGDFAKTDIVSAL